MYGPVRTVLWADGATAPLTRCLKNIIGGSNNSYTEMCEQTRESAYQKMVDHAESIGANAVVAFRFDSDGVGGDQTRANEVFCYGTAVRVR